MLAGRGAPLDITSRQLAEMADTSDLLAREEDLPAMLQTLATRALELVSGDFASVAIFDSPGVAGRSASATANQAGAEAAGQGPLIRDLVADVVKGNRPLRLDSLESSPYFSDASDGGPGFDRFIGVSLRAGGAAIGWLSIMRGRAAPPFSEADELAAGVLASQATAALVNNLTRERLSLEGARADAVIGAIDYGVLEVAPGGTVRSVNHAAERLLAYDASALVGQDFHGLLHSSLRDAAHTSEECRITEVLGTGITYQGDDAFRRGDGKRIDVSLSTAAVATASGTPHGMSSSFTMSRSECGASR